MELPFIGIVHKKNLDHNHDTTLEQPSVVMVNSGNENRNYDNRGIRVCEHCQKEYVARHFKQRFCSTDCRLNFHKFDLRSHKKQA